MSLCNNKRNISRNNFLRSQQRINLGKSPPTHRRLEIPYVSERRHQITRKSTRHISLEHAEGYLGLHAVHNKIEFFVKKLR